MAGTRWGEHSVRAAEAQGTARSESSPHRLEGKTGAALFLEPLWRGSGNSATAHIGVVAGETPAISHVRGRGGRPPCPPVSVMPKDRVGNVRSQVSLGSGRIASVPAMTFTCAFRVPGGEGTRRPARALRERPPRSLPGTPMELTGKPPVFCMVRLAGRGRFPFGRAEARPSPWRAPREGLASARPCGHPLSAAPGAPHPRAPQNASFFAPAPDDTPAAAARPAARPPPFPPRDPCGIRGHRRPRLSSPFIAHFRRICKTRQPPSPPGGSGASPPSFAL